MWPSSGTHDPSPFRGRDLDDGAAAYILDAATAAPPTEALHILVRLSPGEMASPAAAQLGDSVRQFFQQRAARETRALREHFRFGRRALAIGLPILGA